MATKRHSAAKPEPKRTYCRDADSNHSRNDANDANIRRSVIGGWISRLHFAAVICGDWHPRLLCVFRGRLMHWPIQCCASLMGGSQLVDYIVGGKQERSHQLESLISEACHGEGQGDSQ